MIQPDGIEFVYVLYYRSHSWIYLKIASYSQENLCDFYGDDHDGMKTTIAIYGSWSIRYWLHLVITSAIIVIINLRMSALSL